MELTTELIRKHKDLIEVTVKSHQSRSKKGKIFNVKQHERNVRNMSDRELNAEIDNKGPMMQAARTELSHRANKIQRDRVEQRTLPIPLAKPYKRLGKKKKSKTWKNEKQKMDWFTYKKG